MTIQIQHEIGSDLTLTQATAYELHGIGLNVFPLLIGKKLPCFSWSRMQTTRLHPTHHKYGVHAVFAGRCNIGVMCGHTSGNLFIIDLETPEAFEYHLNQIRERHIPVFASETARGGHIWLRCAEGEVSNIASGSISDGELRGSNSYIVAPPSVHPTGAFYEWYIREVAAPPLVSIAHIDWLVDGNNAPIKLELVTKSEKTRTGYSRTVQEYLDNGHNLPEGSRNDRAFKATCALISSGIDEDQASELIMPVAMASGLSERESHDIVRKAYKNYGSGEQNEQNRKPLAWEYALAFAESHNWSGRTSSTDRSVMLAFIERARIGTNNASFRASYRELAQLARCTLVTIQASIKRLISEGFVCHQGNDKLSNATLWTFTETVLTEGKKICETNTLNTRGRSSVIVSQKTDAIERGALGQTGWRIYQTLLSSESPMRVKDIALEAGLTANQVYNFLSTGESHNDTLLRSKLVEKVGKGWIAHPATDEELDKLIAIPAGKFGNGEKRSQQFANDRSIYIGNLVLASRYKYDRANLMSDTMYLTDFQIDGQDILTNSTLRTGDTNRLSNHNLWEEWLESLPTTTEVFLNEDYEFEMSLE